MTKRFVPPFVAGLALFVLWLGSGQAGRAANFLAGADFSLLPFFESHGIAYRDKGNAEDALHLLQQRGLNCVRLRLFTSSAAQASADPYNYVNNLAYTVPLAVRVKAAGLQLCLDVHYSDTWADPSHQAKPAAWANLAFSNLLVTLRQYTSNSIAVLNAAGAAPDYVQLGNEITGGMLWPDGEVTGSYNTPAQWSKLGQLLNAATSGLDDAVAAGAPRPKIIIHIDRGGDWATTEWFFDNLNVQHVAYDIIGESYYPFWHGDPSLLASCLTNAAARYQKPVVVMETAFPWSNSTNIYGFTATTNGQVQYTAALAQILKTVRAGRGMGIFWWGSEYQALSGYNLAGFDKRSFFNSAGDILPVADTFGAMVAPLTIQAALSGGNLTLTWPLSGAGMTLWSSTNLAAASWSRVTNDVPSSGSRLTITVPWNASQNCFYRLAPSP